MDFLANIIINTFDCIWIALKWLSKLMLYSYSLVFCIGIIMFICRFKLLKNYKNTNKLIEGNHFMSYVRLPKERDFFQKCLKNNYSPFKTVLPIIDFNDYDFTDVSIENCVFHKDSVLPKDVDFFQKIKNKSLKDCTLPSGDYSCYNFNKVIIDNCKFTEDSILPLNYSFFKDLQHRGYLSVKLPQMFNANCHLYDLTNIELKLPRKINVSDSQMLTLFYRYNNELPEFIKQKRRPLKI